jgi:predicted SprT family Zn-dependent metalloprotease
MNLDEAANLARRLMDEHGLSHWTFVFDRAARRFGSCAWTIRQITLSWKLTLLNDEARVRETILHEIAHALTPGDGHGKKWKAACKRLGIAPERCYSESDVVSPGRSQSRYEIGCLNCGHWHPRFRRPTQLLICRTCRKPAILRLRDSSRCFRLRLNGYKLQFDPVDVKQAHPSVV